MSDNGNRPRNGFRAMPPGGGIPLIGQPIEIWGWFPTVSFGCRCQAPQKPPTPMLVAGVGSIVKCPACGAHYMIGAITMNAEQGVCEVSISRVTPTHQPATDAAPAAPTPPDDPPAGAGD